MRPLAFLTLFACATPPPETAKDGDSDTPDTPETVTDTDTDSGSPQREETGVFTQEIRLSFVEAPDVAPVGEEIRVVVRISGIRDPESATITVQSDADGPVGAATWEPAANGYVFVSSTLSAGLHVLTFDATSEHGAGSATLDVGVCEWPALEDFATGIGADWRAYNDAVWDPGGWLEITTNDYNRRGAIFKISRKINPGDFRMEFDIATGGGVGTGADGYAVSIVDVADIPELEAWINAAAAGGCLAYGSAPPCANYPINAFHVEFDTWWNSASPVTDPTPNNHIGVTLDGNPSDHILWESVPNLEDLAWRHVVVQILGTQIRVRLDGVLIMDDAIPNFTFDGGYIGVTGSTGAATNYHRFDNLQLYDRCDVPER